MEPNKTEIKPETLRDAHRISINQNYHNDTNLASNAPIFLLCKCQTPKPGILSNFLKIHRLQAIENLHPFKWNTVS
ncbi:hypothetical protein T4B_3543, partial [Trichinella pseudospiralis]